MKNRRFTLVEIMVVVAILGILATIAVPNWINTRKEARKKGCLNNLRQIDAAKQQWAMDSNAADTDAPNWNDLVNTSSPGTSYMRTTPFCRENGSYVIGNLIAIPSCNISGHSLN